MKGDRDLLNVLWAARPGLWPEWQASLQRETEGVARIVDQVPDPAAVDAILITPDTPIRDFAPYANARLVQSLWAGVERITGNETLTQPLARMVDPGLAEGMVDYCLGWVMRRHLRMDRYTQDGVWRNEMIPPLARERAVTVLGAGELGGAVARRLAAVGFDTVAWSASGRAIEGVEVWGGPDALTRALQRAEILVTLLPATPATDNLLDATRLALLPKGAAIINPGRGTLIDDKALLAALDSGALAHAILDVFRTEPLPPEHPFWRNPRVTVTPHIAAETRPSTAAPIVAENLRRVAAGQTPLHLVDRGRGY